MTEQVRQSVEIVEVGPRDGFQSVAGFIPTDQKIALLRGLAHAGVRRVEATSFVSDTALPQMSDAITVLEAANAIDGFEPMVLAPTLRHAERAFAAGARHLAFVVSVSEWHNYNNVRRTPLESVAEFARIVAAAPQDASLRLNIATAFDCPEQGRIPVEDVMALLKHLEPESRPMEVALCDTTGRADPAHVTDLFDQAFKAHPGVAGWAFHGHDTYGLGAANVLAAWQTGVRVIDASFAGLGGCPFAPGATGNVATEDVVWMFQQMGVETGIDLAALIAVADQVTDIPGAQTGGRVRDAWRARQRLKSVAE